MKRPSRRERIAAQLADLKLPGALEALDDVLAGVDGGGTTAAEAMEKLLAAQISLRTSRLPALKTLGDTLAELIDSLEEARAAGNLNWCLKTLSHPALLIVSEIGYLPVTQSGPPLFFQLVNRRYEHASTLLTSSKGFEEWDRVRGNSYRMRRRADLSKAIHPGGAPDVSPPGASTS
ncbi:ATP-binding protein [Candidatus Palauibacter sp.]|uniref:ATP-binding protein n=1 Tax=Candidatus Palauibacter sp. TaxID=3101350 RepID=UPI003B025232